MVKSRNAAPAPGAENGDPVAVLECQVDPEVAFQRAAHGVAGQGAQQLAAGGLVRRWDLVVGARAAVGGRPFGQVADEVPRIGQRVADTGEGPGVVDLAVPGLGGQCRRHGCGRLAEMWVTGSGCLGR